LEAVLSVFGKLFPFKNKYKDILQINIPPNKLLYDIIPLVFPPGDDRNLTLLIINSFNFYFNINMIEKVIKRYIAVPFKVIYSLLRWIKAVYFSFILFYFFILFFFIK
jgi:hypothetical protein